jgi:hypothetical protein
MKTVYQVWHQAEGIVGQVAFGQPPTDAQVEAIRAQLAPKWPGFENCEMRVREVTLIEWAELPELVGIEPFVVSPPGVRALIGLLEVNATGHVTE